MIHHPMCAGDRNPRSRLKSSVIMHFGFHGFLNLGDPGTSYKRQKCRYYLSQFADGHSMKVTFIQSPQKARNRSGSLPKPTARTTRYQGLGNLWPISARHQGRVQSRVQCEWYSPKCLIPNSLKFATLIIQNQFLFSCLFRYQRPNQ